VDFGLEEHQDQLLRTAQQWIERSWSKGTISSSVGRRSLWVEVVENGWAGLLEQTGDGATVLDAALLVEELSHGGCSLPIVGGGLLAPLTAEVAGLGVPAGGAGLLAFETGGETEPAARGLEIFDSAIAVRWTHEGGSRSWEVAEISLDDAGLVADQEEERFSLSRMADAEVLRSASWAAADPSAMEAVWRVGAVLTAAELVGLARAVLARCVDYAGTRVQGGKPIGGHQAIQHRLADMLAGIDQSRYATCWAAAHPDDQMAVHQAKALAARDCVSAIRAAHQVMGAISFSAEDELHHFHKQALLAANEFGSANHHWTALERLSS